MGTNDPYRAAELGSIEIEPDTRRRRAAIIFVVGLAVGGAVAVGGTYLRQAFETSRLQASVAARIQGSEVGRPPGPQNLLTRKVSSSLAGPQMPVIVHVWLQGCSDCMPAFEAMRAIQLRGGLRGRTINISYGQAEQEWADRYGVGDNLRADMGGKEIVTPLGISSFTTLVLDQDHTVVWQDRADRPGYEASVEGAYRIVLEQWATRQLSAASRSK